LQVALTQVAGKAGGRDAIVLGEGRVAVDVAAEAFAKDEFGVRDVEVRMQLSARRALKAVIGPECLFAVRCIERISEWFEIVGAGERDVPGGMPVLSKDNVIEAGGKGVDAGNDEVAAGDGKCSAGQEVQLHVDDEKRVGRAEREGHEPLYEPERVIGANETRRYPQWVILLQTVLRELRSRLDLRLLGPLALCVVASCSLQRATAQEPGAALGLPDAPSSIVAAESGAAQVLLGNISGIVSDADGAVVSGARVTLVISSAKGSRTAVSNVDGRFNFAGVAAGRFTITIEAEGLASETQTGTLDPGEGYEIREITLPVASVASQVDAMSVYEQAEDEIKVEEHQRLIGVIPNFYVAYNWNSAPLSTKQKYKLALMNTIDPANVGIAVAIAGYEQWRGDFSGYGPGPQGYGKRFGANYGDLAVGTFVGGAILPSLLHQDPRYFYMGTGTTMHRFWYAMASAVICKGDNGKWQPNYSSIGGDVAAGAISNVYYPANDRDGASTVITQGLIGALADGLGNVVQEFLFKRITPHSANYSSTTPQPKVAQP